MVDVEIAQIKEYGVLKDYGKAEWEGKTITNATHGHQKIRVHFVFAAKHCGKFKVRLVADGHLAKEPTESVYSGVVSLRGLRLVMFLVELNKLQLWGGDIGNAYLETLTKEKLYIIAGHEFGELQGHILIFCKNHYMEQGLEVHVGMANSLTPSNTWVFRHQRQTLTSG